MRCVGGGRGGRGKGGGEGRECISPATGVRGQVGGNLIIHENFPIERERHFPEVGVVNNRVDFLIGDY